MLHAWLQDRNAWMISHETRRDRVLTVVLCETRSWQATWESVDRNIIKVLDSDLALCISGHAFDQTPFHEQADYFWLIEEPEDWAKTYSEVAGNDEWLTLLEIDRRFIGTVGEDSNPELGSGAIQFYFRHLLRNSIISSDLLAKYDWFLLIRSDFIWLAPHPPLQILPKEAISVLDGQNHGGVCDRYAMIPSGLMMDYLEIFEPIFFQPKELRIEIETAINRGVVNSVNPESFLKIRLAAMNLLDDLFRIPYFGFAVRLPGGGTRGAPGRYSRKLGLYIKYPMEYIAARITARWVQTQRDWVPLLSHNDSKSVRRTALEIQTSSLLLGWRVGKGLKRQATKFRTFLKKCR